MDYQNRDYKKIFSKRLNDLSENYVQRKRQEIAEINKDIDKQNREKKKKAKLQMMNVDDLPLLPTIKSYSLEKLVEDIKDIYSCDIDSRNFNLYRKGDSFPSKP